MNLLDRIQDIFYDIIGSFVPGLFALTLLLPLFLHGNTFAFSFFRKGPVAMLFEMESLQTTHNSFMLIIIIGFLAYLTGHVIRFIPVFFSTIHKKFSLRNRLGKGNKKKYKPRHFCFLSSWVRLFIKKRYSYVDAFARNTTLRFKTEHPDKWDTYFHNCPCVPKMLQTYVSTSSRFDGSTNHLTKYHNKKTFFLSLKVVSGFLLADFAITGLLLSLFDYLYLIASLLLVYQSSSAGFINYYLFGIGQIAKLVALPTLIKLGQIILVYLLYCTFLYEELRHEKLYKKELAFYMDSILAKHN